MNAKELREKSPADLEKELLELRKAQFGLRMQAATQQLTNTSQIGKVRKDIARVKTIQREKAVAKRLTQRNQQIVVPSKVEWFPTKCKKP
jgi:large subunit ribosomal protein L29